MNRRTFLERAGIACASPFLSRGATAVDFDLSKCVIVGAEGATPREKKALAVLSEEIERRSQVRLPIQMTKTSRPRELVVYAGTRQSARTLGNRVAPGLSAATSLAPE